MDDKKQETKKKETSEPGMVQVFSIREGSITLSKTQVLRKNCVLSVTVEQADYLEKCFPGLVKRVV